MNTNSIAKAINSVQNGAYITVSVSRRLDYKKGNENVSPIFKVSTYTAQNNIDYANRKAVKKGVESEQREEAKCPAWRENFTQDGARLSRHKKSGQVYLNMNVTHYLTSGYVDARGKAINPADYPIYAKDLPQVRKTKSELEELMQASFNLVKVENVKSYHKSSDVEVEATKRAIEAIRARIMQLKEKSCDGEPA